MMNLYLSAAEYDYHTLLKVAEMAGLAGIIGFHEAGDGYLVTFPQVSFIYVGLFRHEVGLPVRNSLLEWLYSMLLQEK